ncbi:MAG: FtsX-like permease family protein [Bacillota bacterium]|jgi:putative ABC transport system permease protein|nr:MAG: FtsX-like permease family protein [Bacillota bacterium]
MNLLESFRLALDGLRTNAMRSFLTMLGVIIGVGAVVTLVSVGTGASLEVTSQVEALGSNLVIVLPANARGRDLRLEDVTMIESRVEGVIHAVPSLRRTATVVWGGRSVETDVVGTTEYMPAVQNHPVDSGRFLSSQDILYRRQVAVFGATAAQDLFGLKNPVGQEVLIQGYPFTVVGVLTRKGQGGMITPDTDSQVYVPITTAQRIFGTTRVGAIYASVAGGVDAQVVTNHITRMMELRFSDPEAVQVFSQEQILAAVGSVTGILTILLGAIAGISLLVGGIGIMNIMLVSVTERTREIGIRKAVGAKNRDILAQFLVESVIISLTGGLIGIGLGVLGSEAISHLGNVPSVVSLGWVGVAFGFAAAVGVFFGIYPAMKAARLDPIQALRHD